MLEKQILVCDAASGDKMYEATLHYDLSGHSEVTDKLYFRQEVLRQMKFLGHCFFNAAAKLADWCNAWRLHLDSGKVRIVVHQASGTMYQCYDVVRSFRLKGDGGRVSAEDFKSYFIEHSQMEFEGKAEMVEQFMAAVESDSVTIPLIKHILNRTIVGKVKS